MLCLGVVSGGIREISAVGAGLVVGGVGKGAFSTIWRGPSGIFEVHRGTTISVRGIQKRMKY